MSYYKPYVDETGFHYPSYNEILEDLVDKVQNIFGAGTYLGNDSQDYELLSIFAEKVFDVYQTAEVAYNSHSPTTALGTALDYIVALNGISRKQATKSTVELTLVGDPYTVINNGAVADALGYMWDLPETVTLDSSGNATVEAICREAGIIYAAAATVTKIMTPTAGWISVTNANASTTGTVAEKDSELRARQAQSVALPSQSLVTGLDGGIALLDGVTRHAIYENDTNSTDANGIPAHSICCVVEGGTGTEIADTIYKRKTPGCGTYGSTSVVVEDRHNQTYTIYYTPLTYVDVDIVIHVNKRTGWAASMVSEIKTAIIDYLDEFEIGTDLTTSIIWMVAQQVQTNTRNPAFSIVSVAAAQHGQTPGTSDVVIPYNKVARGLETNISVVVDNA